jgi:hypothetical protein
MQIEDWAELIKNVLSPSAFKTVGVAALRALYQRPVTLADGPGDGGVDAWIELSSFPSVRAPVQFHSGRSVPWDRKLAEDIDKPMVKNAPARRLFFVCAQTPTSDKVQRIVADLEQSRGIVVTVVDARGIASQVHDPAVAEALGSVTPVVPGRPRPRADSVHQGTQLAFLFFHAVSGDFRSEVVRSALTACLAQSTSPLPIEDLLGQALALVGGAPDLRRLFRRELEALAAEGKVLADGVLVRATDDVVRVTNGLLGARESAEQKLREDCAAALEGRVHSGELRKEAVDAVFDDLGLLLRRGLVERLPGGHAEALTARLNAVERRLSDTLKPSGGTAHEALQALVEVASASVYGHALASAELFIHLTGRDSVEVARALTGRERIEVLLDTSVAMPVLCAKLDRVAQGWVTSEVASELHEALRKRGIKMSVPHLYIEEMAAHLINAARGYGTIIGEDPDLARSENFFVAHYHSVCASLNEPATPAGFEELLRDLGLPANWETQDFPVVRRAVERALKAHFERYGVEVGWVKFIEALPLQNEPPRADIVLQHDRCVVRWLSDRARESGEGLVLCSQDRWLLQSVAEPDWLAIDPVALLDVMLLVRPVGDARPLTYLRDLAARLDETAVVRAASVWDVLAELEGARLADRHLLRRAKQFKETWLSRARTAERPHAAEWQRFKAGLSPEG